MDPTPFYAFELAQELMDQNPALTYEAALRRANNELDAAHPITDPPRVVDNARR